MTAPGSDEDFAALTRRISQLAGLTLEAYKDKCLRRRIAVRMRASGAHTYGDYHGILERDPGELDRLRDALTINVTRFYRNPETWDALRAPALLPALWRARQGRLAAWSAGCASGEEPYTVAMVVAALAEAEGRPGWLERLQVDATDIDRASLARARAATYRLDAFQDTPPELVARYTRPVPAGAEVTPAVRATVRVEALDLSLGPPLRGRYDLILCRNVVIYFERPTQERLFSMFADLLAPDGLLVLGKVETLLGPARERLTLIDTRERIYRPAA